MKVSILYNCTLYSTVQVEKNKMESYYRSIETDPKLILKYANPAYIPIGKKEVFTEILEEILHTYLSREKIELFCIFFKLSIRKMTSVS